MQIDHIFIKNLDETIIFWIGHLQIKLRKCPETRPRAVGEKTRPRTEQFKSHLVSIPPLGLASFPIKEILNLPLVAHTDVKPIN